MAVRQNDIDRPFILDDELRRPADGPADTRAENIEAPRPSSRVAVFACGAAALLAIAIYGFSASDRADTTASSHAPTQTTQEASSPTVPPDVRDVTPRNNTEPGMTTGAAPSKPRPDNR